MVRKARQILTVLFAAALTAQAKNPKVSADIPSSSSNSVDVIVQFKHTPNAQHASKITNRGGILKSDLSLVNSLHASVPGNRIEDLANDPEVAHISLDRPLSHLGSTTISFDVPAAAINASYAWNSGFIGKGIGVAIIDSGTQDTADLQNASGKTRIVFQQSYITGNTSTVDKYGHGIHVTGLIAGDGDKSAGQYEGVAPGVNVLNFRVLDDSGAGKDSYVIAAIQAAISLQKTYNIRVINLSLGRPVYESYTVDPLCQAVEQAWKAGIVVVVAAGNDGRDNSAGTNGYGTIMAPGNDPYVITVGAMKQMGTPSRGDDLIASYSSKGPTAVDHIVKPDIVAPGNQVISLAGKSTTQLIHSFPQNQVTTDYFVLSGTSMATGVVSGAVADLLQANPLLTPDQVKAILMKSSSKTFPTYSTTFDASTGTTYVSQYDVFTIGAGYLDLQAALGLASNPPAGSLNMLSPTAAFDPNSGDVFFQMNQNAFWGSNAMWGANAVWGSNALWGASVFTGSQSSVGAHNALWGSNALWGNNALWGANTTSGFNALWGNNALWGASSGDATQSLSVSINGEK